MSNIFERASRIGLRFATTKGELTVEDLWHLPLSHSTKVNLDTIAQELHAKVKAQDNEVSFVTKKAAADPSIALGFELVKHIIEVRLAEAEVAAQVKSNRDKREKILELIAAKEGDELSAKSLDELRELAKSL